MSQNLIYVLENDQSLFSNSIRMFFAGINRFLYNWIGNFLDIMYHIAENVQFNEYGEKIVDRLYNILIIFMIFRLTISLLSYIVDPDTFTDKGKGAASLIKRVIISVVILASINPIFELTGNIQHEILNNGIVENLLMGSKNDSVYYTEEGKRVYLTEISPMCDEIGAEKGENLKVATTSPGKHLALLTLKPFIQPTPASDGDLNTYNERVEALYNLGYCGVDITNGQYIDVDDSSLELSFGPFNDTSDYLQWSVYNGMTGTWSFDTNVYYIDFNYFFALITGIIVCLIMISFCFDVVIRALTLVLLKVIAPISTISYISPKGKSSEMLPIWGKKILSTWASLFVRIASVSLAMSVISAMCESGGLTKNSSGMLESLIIILGTLMFAKALPKLLEELIPGLKLGGMELNPFKRISKDALGGNMILGAGAALGGAALSGITNGVQRIGENANRANFKDDRGNVSLRSIASGTGRLLGRTAGSSIAGAARGGINAFNRTRKDGHMFGGMWNGYQTAMYSKLLREDNRRKGGSTLGSIAADLHRYTGTLNKGQQEQIRAQELDNEINAESERISQLKEVLSREKRDLALKKEQTLEPYQQYASYGQKIKDRISNDKFVKDATKALEDAQATGDENAISNARAHLELMEKTASSRLMKTDDEVKYYVEQMDKIRKEVLMKQNVSLADVKKSDGTFNSNSIYETQHMANVIEDRDFKSMEAEFKVREREIEAASATNEARKKTTEYIVTHDDKSKAKVDNATRTNKDVQAAGATFSAERPAQSRLNDQSYYSGFGRGGGPRSGGGPGPGHGGPPPGRP